MDWTETSGQHVLTAQKWRQWCAGRRKGSLPPPWPKPRELSAFSSFAGLRVVQLCQLRFFSSAECLMFKTSTAMHSQSAETTAAPPFFHSQAPLRQGVCVYQGLVLFLAPCATEAEPPEQEAALPSLCHWKWSVCWCQVGGGGEKGWMWEWGWVSWALCTSPLRLAALLTPWWVLFSSMPKISSCFLVLHVSNAFRKH